MEHLDYKFWSLIGMSLFFLCMAFYLHKTQKNVFDQILEKKKNLKKAIQTQENDEKARKDEESPWIR